MRKSDVINSLGEKYGLRAYLGISTPTTGFQHALVDDKLFSAKKDLLVYDAPIEMVLEEGASFRTSACSSFEITATIRTICGPGCYDLVFVDPHHTYENSLLDIVAGFDLLCSDGILVVHDCNPPSAEVAAPSFSNGEWCGLTYMAFIDFVLGRRDITYVTVDTDYGCGIIFKNRECRSNSLDELKIAWAATKLKQDTQTYPFFDNNRRTLLNLLSAKEFCEQEQIVYPVRKLATSDNFCEKAYLASNPDVAKAVKTGDYPSGRYHFEMFGQNEGRQL